MCHFPKLYLDVAIYPGKIGVTDATPAGQNVPDGHAPLQLLFVRPEEEPKWPELQREQDI